MDYSPYTPDRCRVETLVHINKVMLLLAHIQVELAKRMFTHDRSKLESPELYEFTIHTPMLRETTYGSKEYFETLAEMEPALKHHYANNRHHPQFFENGVNDMNLIDVVEMFCDWYASAKRHDDGDIKKSLEINVKRFDLSPQLSSILTNTIAVLERNEFENLRTQKDL